MSIISVNLKKARKAIPGLSQDQAAKLLGTNRKRISAWEEGRTTPPLALFPRIVQAYQITDWIGFISSEKFDPMKQLPPEQTRLSYIEERYKKLPKKLRKVADELLNCS